VKPTYEQPPAAVRVFGRGAFRGSLPPSANPNAAAAARAPAPDAGIGPAHVSPVRVTDFSAPNRVRRGWVPIDATVIHHQDARNNDQIFVSQSRTLSTIKVRRRSTMEPPRQLRKLVPSRRVVYEAGMFGRDSARGFLRPWEAER